MVSNCSAGKYKVKISKIIVEHLKKCLFIMIFFADLNVVGRFLIGETWQGDFQHFIPNFYEEKMKPIEFTHEIITFKNGQADH